MNDIKRGEIFYISRGGVTTGSEQFSDRPVVVVSNDKGNQNGGTVVVVYLTTQPKTDLPTHCTIRSTGRISTALCEQVHTVSIERVGKYIGQCTDAEMKNIDIALMISLSLDAGTKTSKQYNETIERQQETIESLKAEIESMKKEKAENEAVEQSRNSAEAAGEEIIRTRTERDTYKALYESLFERMLAS